MTRTILEDSFLDDKTLHFLFNYGWRYKSINHKNWFKFPPSQIYESSGFIDKIFKIRKRSKLESAYSKRLQKDCLNMPKRAEEKLESAYSKRLQKI